jgi:hypothetical protein
MKQTTTYVVNQEEEDLGLDQILTTMIDSLGVAFGVARTFPPFVTPMWW